MKDKLFSGSKLNEKARVFANFRAAKAPKRRAFNNASLLRAVQTFRIENTREMFQQYWNGACNLQDTHNFVNGNIYRICERLGKCLQYV